MPQIRSSCRFFQILTCIRRAEEPWGYGLVSSDVSLLIRTMPDLCFGLCVRDAVHPSGLSRLSSGRYAKPDALPPIPPPDPENTRSYPHNGLT